MRAITPTGDEASRQQLDRILASATFRQVDRLKRFLKFVGLEALGGHGDQLKEYVIGVQVFDKDSSSIRALTLSCACRPVACARGWCATTGRRAGRIRS